MAAKRSNRSKKTKSRTQQVTPPTGEASSKPSKASASKAGYVRQHMDLTPAEGEAKAAKDGLDISAKLWSVYKSQARKRMGKPAGRASSKGSAKAAAPKGRMKTGDAFANAVRAAVAANGFGVVQARFEELMSKYRAILMSPLATVPFAPNEGRRR